MFEPQRVAAVARRVSGEQVGRCVGHFAGRGDSVEMTRAMEKGRAGVCIGAALEFMCCFYYSGLREFRCISKWKETG